MHQIEEAVQSVLQILRDPLVSLALSLLLFLLSKSPQKKETTPHFKKNQLSNVYATTKECVELTAAPHLKNFSYS
jgi:hypothetical protein